MTLARWSRTVRLSRLLAVLSIALFLMPETPARASNCDGTSVGFVPLTDLNGGEYQGFPGGFYGTEIERSAGRESPLAER